MKEKIMEFMKNFDLLSVDIDTILSNKFTDNRLFPFLANEIDDIPDENISLLKKAIILCNSYFNRVAYLCELEIIKLERDLITELTGDNNEMVLHGIRGRISKCKAIKSWCNDEMRVYGDIRYEL